MNNKDFPLLLKQNLAVWIVFTIIFLSGLLTFNDYGQSWDEGTVIRLYADESIKAYTSWYEKGEIEIEHQVLQYYGAFFPMFVKVSSECLLFFFSSLHPFDANHLIYFLAYFVGVISFYTLAQRWFSQATSLGVTLLFATQPLFWGHAFINPKDIPFMALFLLSIATGFNMVDKTQSEPLEPKLESSKKLLMIYVIWLISILCLFTFTEAIHNSISNLVISAKSGESNIVTLLASKLDQVPAQVYIRRYFLLFLRIRTIYFIVSFVLLLFAWRKSQPSLLKTFFIVFFPAIVLGLATSTRILGPFAGVIVVFYTFYKLGKKAFPPLIMYVIVALTAMYLTWPYLWTNPVLNFIASLNQMSSYPWRGEVLLNGELYYSYDLPYYYLPVLLFVQMTEPIWLLVIIGIVISIYYFKRYSEIVILFCLWFLLPLISFIILRPTLYDNFRQLLFILPSVFLIPGVVFERIKSKVWQIVFITVCLFPNVLGIVSLHPYEYIYYNSFVSQSENLHDRFETDYWLTSYREAAEYINQIASPNATVWVEGPGRLFTPFAREDLIVNSQSSYTEVDSYNYIVVTTRFNLDQTIYPKAEVIYQIKRGNAVLTIIKQP